MFLRFLIRNQLKKAGINKPESLIMAVDYDTDKGEVIAEGKDFKDVEIKKSSVFIPSKESGENSDLYKVVLSSKKYYKLNSVIMLFDLIENKLTTKVFYTTAENEKITDVNISKL
jgi:hypothetical protein